MLTFLTKLDRALAEGIVDTARGRITTTINTIAGQVARAADAALGGDRRLAALLSYSGAQVEFADEEDEPAVVMLRLGSRAPEAVAITIYGDSGGEIKLEMSERLSKLLHLPRLTSLATADQVGRKLGEMAALMKGLAGRAGNVYSPNPA